MTDAPFNSNAARAAEGEFSRACAALVALPLLGDEPGGGQASLAAPGPASTRLFKQPGGFVAAALLASEGITSVRLWLHAMRTRWLFSWLR